MFWVIDNSKAKKDFSFVAKYPFPNGIKRTIDWFKAKGVL